MDSFCKPQGGLPPQTALRLFAPEPQDGDPKMRGRRRVHPKARMRNGSDRNIPEAAELPVLHSCGRYFGIGEKDRANALFRLSWNAQDAWQKFPIASVRCMRDQPFVFCHKKDGEIVYNLEDEKALIAPMGSAMIEVS